MKRRHVLAIAIAALAIIAAVNVRLLAGSLAGGERQNRCGIACV
ncbi:hypothetical protein QUW28_04145 [Enorma phocaeensis]|uniref:Uncharacterized protein n=1 Tax=Enorma phocaeensis TaxID=1871019 RepID=A0ABT7V873_9ACTN|nr:hypothetical protein [Enorma phocaeensis]